MTALTEREYRPQVQGLTIGEVCKSRENVKSSSAGEFARPSRRLSRRDVAKGDQRSTMANRSAPRHADRHQEVGEGRRGCGWLCKRKSKSKRSGIMSEDGRFEIPKEMRTMAEASFDQARKAFDKFLAGAQQTAGTLEER